jgi:hypothetical protein
MLNVPLGLSHRLGSGRSNVHFTDLYHLREDDSVCLRISCVVIDLIKSTEMHFS